MSYLNNHIHNIHFVGIGGVSMSALAEIMLQKGYHVTGSDMQKSQAVTTLVTKGIDIIIGHKSQNVNGKDLIIYTGAVKKDNPELVEAARLGIPAVERAPFMGELLSKYQNPIAVSGTHGKTTTTSMLAQIFLDSEKDPTVLVGGAMPATGTNYHIGHSDTIIFEACEYLNSFLNFPSKIAVVLNIDADHLDFFRDIDEIKASFSKFISKTGSDGTAVLCGDDKNCRDIAKNYQGTSVYTSLVDPTADYFAEIKSISGYPVFDVYEHGKLLGDLSLIIPGRHNVYNALAAIAVARISGISFEEIKSSLSKFKGARRRFEYVFQGHGVLII
ncbi:MAG: Mur ligase family protein [Bacillota bacterium]|nr:Mur ligase family protein [Bacillota bacterium]